MAYCSAPILKKDTATLEFAYNDPTGVTAAFDKNLLGRINRELGGHFDLDAFEHVARYDARRGAVDSFLVSQRGQNVAIDALDAPIFVPRCRIDPYRIVLQVRANRPRALGRPLRFSRG